MTYLALDRLHAAPVSADPFPHLLVRDFVPEPGLSDVVRDLPALARRGSYPITGLRLGPAAAAMVHELEGVELRAAIADRFGLDLGDAATMVTLRGQSTERDGKIHTDSTAKRVTVLLYLNPETDAWARQEGCLRLLRDPRNIEDFAVEVPPVNGTLLIFPNGPTAWHGHKPFIGRRYVVQLNYMATDSQARSELRRHRLSAFLKRLSPAA